MFTLLPVFRFLLWIVAEPVSAEPLRSINPALAGVKLPESGLGGRLAVLIPRGGCGNALILIVFLTVFPGVFTNGVDLTLGNVLLPELGVEICDDEGVRRPLFGMLGVAGKSDNDGTPPVLFRVLIAGRAGNADIGGPFEGLNGLGRVAIVRSHCPVGAGFTVISNFNVASPSRNCVCYN